MENNSKASKFISAFGKTGAFGGSPYNYNDEEDNLM
jgi:hypothetical protein